jgi:nitrogen fixation/metabolism regulation signal transduction histidine kinase
MKTEKRRRNLSKHKVQVRLVARIALHWLIFFVTAFAVLYFWQLLLSGDPFDFFSVAVGEVLERSAPVFVVLVVLIPLFVWDTVKLSNRIVCPVSRLESAMARLAAGEIVEPMACRLTDPWQPLFSEFNLLLERVDGVDRAGRREELIAAEATSGEEMVV